MEVEDKGNEQPCSMHEQEQTSAEVGPDNVSQEILQKDSPQDVHGGTYGPWVVVASKKNETRAHRNGGTPVGQFNAQATPANVGTNGFLRKVLGHLERQKGSYLPQGLSIRPRL